MKHLGNYLKVIPFSAFIDFDGTDINSGSYNVETVEFPILVKSNSDVILKEKPEVTDAGTRYLQTFKIISDKLTDAIRAKYPPSTPVVVLLYTDDGAVMALGDIESRLRLTITPNVDYDTLSFTRQTLTPLF